MIKDDDIWYFHEHHTIAPSDNLLELEKNIDSVSHTFGAAHSVPDFMNAKYDYNLLLPNSDDFNNLKENFNNPDFWAALKTNKASTFKGLKEEKGEPEYYATVFAMSVAKDTEAFDRWKQTFGRDTMTKAELVHGIRYAKHLGYEEIPSLDLFMEGCLERIKEMVNTDIHVLPDGTALRIQVPGRTTTVIYSLDDLVSDASINMNNPTVHNKVLFDFLHKQEEEIKYNFNYVVKYSKENNETEAYVFFNPDIVPLYLIGNLNSDLDIIMRTLEPRDQDIKSKLIL